MFRLERAYKTYNEAGSFNEQVNLFGFVDDQVFLTKSGDVGLALRVHGVDYECLDSAAIDILTKRLESAFKIFDENCRVYQYLCKRRIEPIEPAPVDQPVVHEAVQRRAAYLNSRRTELYALDLFLVLTYEMMSPALIWNEGISTLRPLTSMWP